MPSQDRDRPCQFLAVDLSLDQRMQILQPLRREADGLRLYKGHGARVMCGALLGSRRHRDGQG